MKKLILLFCVFGFLTVSANDINKLKGSYTIKQIQPKSENGIILVEALNNVAKIIIDEQTFIMYDKKNEIIDKYRITDITEFSFSIKGNNYRYINDESKLKIESLDAIMELTK